MSDRDQPLLRLSLLLRLGQRARAAEPEELQFVILNETRGLVRYDQAALWLTDAPAGPWRLAGLSGVSSPDRTSPYWAWLERLGREIVRSNQAGPPAQEAQAARPLTAADCSPDAAADWPEFAAAHALWLPLASPLSGVRGALLLWRTEPWEEAELRLLAVLGENYAHALFAQTALGRRPVRRSWRRLAGPLLLAAAAILAAWPMDRFLLCKAEVAAKTPVLVRAPLDGVVDRFLVRPNERVQAGQVLLRLDDAQLASRLEVARKAMDIAGAEYQQAVQQALIDPAAKGRIALLLSRLRQEEAEARYLQGQLDKVDVRAPADGVAVFEDASEWLGRPVSVGQKLLFLADENRTELEILMPAEEALDLSAGTDILFFPNADPLSPLRGRLHFVGFRAAPTPDGYLAYKLKADLDRAEAPPRLGAKGVAKVFGRRQPLGLIVLGKPLRAVGQWLAW